MDRRKFLENLGLAGAGATGAAVLGKISQSEVQGAEAVSELYLPLVTNGAANHFSGIIVAAADASAAEKDGAHFVCSGINDQAVINQAIKSLGEVGGLVA